MKGASIMWQRLWFVAGGNVFFSGWLCVVCGSGGSVLVESWWGGLCGCGSVGGRRSMDWGGGDWGSGFVLLWSERGFIFYACCTAGIVVFVSVLLFLFVSFG